MTIIIILMCCNGFLIALNMNSYKYELHVRTTAEVTLRIIIYMAAAVTSQTGTYYFVNCITHS